MNTLTDVMIHTKSALNDDEFSEVARKIKAITGIERFDRSSHKPNFILVTYQTEKIRALTILNKFTSLGFNASLVGI